MNTLFRIWYAMQSHLFPGLEWVMWPLSIIIRAGVKRSRGIHVQNDAQKDEMKGYKLDALSWASFNFFDMSIEE